MSHIVPRTAWKALDAIAANRGISRYDALRIAIGVFVAMEDACADGLYVGGVRDREVLERVILPRAVP